MGYISSYVDVAVVGAGHAGIEAALAASRLGCDTIIFTINLDSVGNLPCNPAIGGTAKGHLVRELDALGGEMGKAADATFLQSRMLNRGKGPAVHSLRAQIDRRMYSGEMKERLERQKGLQIKQAEIISIKKSDKPGYNWILETQLGAVFYAKAAVLATGTFLGGRIYVGEVSYESGPDGMFPATALAESLKALGMPLRRFKTGTPARIRKSSVDFSGLEPQEGDEPVTPFSYDTKEPGNNQVLCHITWTNAETKRIILENLHRSPLYAGMIEGVGPRYCPSIEDKIVRFADKERHQVFIEPCGLHTEEMYLQGVSSSLPEEVQIALYHTIPGLEHAEIMRNAYAIEYDCVDPTALDSTLEVLSLPYLFGAGQFNGSSGYEEAAVQGFVAGINAVHKILGKEAFVLDRSSSYIGTLIDDLVTKGCADPYRMMTSRSEYRLVLRQDNADERLMPIGRKLSLINDRQWAEFEERQSLKNQELERIEKTILPPSEKLNQILVSRETSPVNTGIKLSELLRRPQLTYAALKEIDTQRPKISPAILEQVAVQVKYSGYIKRQNAQIREAQRLENKSLSIDMDYSVITNLRLEAIEKLNKIKPRSVGQASRISGVSPADISVLLIWLEKQNKKV